MTSIGALTTTFTPAAACASSTGLYIVDCGTGDGCVWWAEGPLDSGGGCYPDNYNPSLSHYYSPGVCPSGYTAGCTSYNSVGSETETVYTCCPTALGYDFGCVNSLYPWQGTLGCTTSISSTTMITWSDATYVNQFGQSTSPFTTTRSECGIGAYAVEVRTMSTASSTGSSSGASSASTTGGSSTSSGGSGGTAGAGNTNGNRGGRPGLSAGAGAGIGVGALVVLLLAIGAAVLVWRGKRRTREPRIQQQHHQFYKGGGDGADYSHGYNGQIQELQYAQPKWEMQGHQTDASPHELPGPNRPSELSS